MAQEPKAAALAAAREAQRNVERARAEQKTWTETRNARIREAYEAGAIIPEIAEAVGVSRETVSVAAGKPRVSGKAHSRARKA